MESDLQQKISALADIEDIEGMTQLLCEWPHKTPEWLLYINVRIGAPSTNKEQKSLLTQMKAEALAFQPELAEQLMDEFLETLQSKTSNGQKNEQEKQKDFVFAQEDCENFEIIDTLQEFECWDVEEITDYIVSLDYGELGEPIQHLVNQYIYGLTANGQESEPLKAVAKQPEYLEWCQSFAPEFVLADDNFGVEGLLRLARLDNEVELISKKDYYAYLLESGDEDHEIFDDFLREFGGLNDFTKVATDDQIEQFEDQFAIKLPEELKIFYQYAGSLYGTASKPCRFFSISELEYHLDSSRKRYEHLRSMGLLNMLEFIWGNNKDDFSPASGNLTQDQIDYLNQHYTAIGYIPVDDNANVAIYFDRQHRFGTVWYHQDNAVVYKDYLDVLLEKSQAQYGLCQLLAVIPFILTNPLFEEEQEQYIADLAHKK